MLTGGYLDLVSGRTRPSTNEGSIYAYAHHDAGCAALLALATAVGVSAANFTPGPLVQVSGATMFANCTADDVGEQSGTNFLNSEVEPWIDFNPTDAGQRHRYLAAGPLVERRRARPRCRRELRRWQQLAERRHSRDHVCSGGDYQRSTDPWVSFGPDGVVYQLALSFNDIAPPFTAFDFDHALLASKSTDGGLTWSDPEVVIRDPDANVFNDKQTITADPTDADLVYAVWDRLVFPNERANLIASFTTSAFRGPVWFARSTDGGDSWEPARQIYDPGQNDQTIGNQIVVLPDGTLVDLFDEIHNDNSKKQRGFSVRVMRSTDQGDTWSGPIFIDLLGTIFIDRSGVW